MADSCDVHEPLNDEGPAFISGMSRLSAIAGLAVLAWGLLLGRNLFPARVPAWFNENCDLGTMDERGRKRFWKQRAHVIWSVDL